MTCHGTDVTGASSPPLTSSSSSRLRAAEPLTQPLRGDVTVTSPRRPWPAGPWRPRPQRRSRAVTMRGRRSSDDVTIAAGADVTAARRDVTVMAPAACWRRRSVSLMASSIGNVAASSTIARSLRRFTRPVCGDRSDCCRRHSDGVSTAAAVAARHLFHVGRAFTPRTKSTRRRSLDQNSDTAARATPHYPSTSLSIYLPSPFLSAGPLAAASSADCSLCSPRLLHRHPSTSRQAHHRQWTHTRARGRGPNGHTGVDTAEHWTGRPVGGGRQAQSIARAQQTRPINELTGGAGRHCSSSSSRGRRQQETSSHDTAGGYTRTDAQHWQQRVQLNAIYKRRVYTACIRYTANTTQRSGVMHSALHPSGVA